MLYEVITGQKLLRDDLADGGIAHHALVAQAVHQRPHQGHGDRGAEFQPPGREPGGERRDGDDEAAPEARDLGVELDEFLVGEDIRAADVEVASGGLGA